MDEKRKSNNSTGQVDALFHQGLTARGQFLTLPRVDVFVIRSTTH